MSFISFLKQFGLDVLKGVQIFEGIEPIASAAVSAISPTVGAKLDSIDSMAGAALTVESSFAAAFGPNNQTGPAKFAALVPQIQQIVTASQFMIGKQVADPALFTKAMQEYAQATADCLNSLKPSVKTGNNVGTPPVPVAALPMPPVVPVTPAAPATPVAPATIPSTPVNPVP
jgi:hypothetical protein